MISPKNFSEGIAVIDFVQGMLYIHKSIFNARSRNRRCIQS